MAKIISANYISQQARNKPMRAEPAALHNSCGIVALDIPEAKMKDFLPYAYLKLALPSTTRVPLPANYWVNLNKYNKRISH